MSKIATVIQRFLPEVLQQGSLSGHQRSVLNLMQLCKTSALGGHLEQCEGCSHTKVHYNSCGNRNCPSCQGVNKHRWILDRKQDLLPVKYFHSVFTIPSELYPYFRYNKALLCDLLLKCIKDTLLCLGKDKRYQINGLIGGVLLLHTWTQQLTYHPHVHCIIPAGGLTSKGEWKSSKSSGDYLFPVLAMSRLFRGKLMAAIHDQYQSGNLQLPADLRKKYKSTKNKLYNRDWVAYAKRAFGGPDQVLEYLGRYTHKICISNHRILKVSQTHVTYRHLDRKKKQSKVKRIKGADFLRLFAEHILPKGFVKIRHIGFLSSRSKKKHLSLIRKSLGVQAPPSTEKLTARKLIIQTTGKDPYVCKVCNQGEMVIVKFFNPIRGSPYKVYQRGVPVDRKVKIKK